MTPLVVDLVEIAVFATCQAIACYAALRFIERHMQAVVRR